MLVRAGTCHTSHFEASIKLTDDYQLIKESFADKNSEELFGYNPSNQSATAGAFPFNNHHRDVKHAKTCLSIIKPQMSKVGIDGPPVNSLRTLEKADEVDSNDIDHTNPMCYCDGLLPWGSRESQSHDLITMRLQDGIEAVATSLVGGSETHPSQHTTTTVSHCECLSSTVWKPKNSWLLQSDGSYKPVPYEQVGGDLLNSEVRGVINPLPRITTPPRVFQTWGIIATLIKEQEQLDESHIQTSDNSLDAGENLNTTLSALTYDEDITKNNIGDENTSQCSDQLSIEDTEHDVFNDFIYKGDDPNLDPLRLIKVEGSPSLRIRIRKLLEANRSVFATTLPDESALIPPFELTVDKEKWERSSNRGPPRVQSPAKQAEIKRQVDELLRTKVIEHSNASYYSQVILASKPDDTWRFCIDFRSLNDCTQQASWPIPNIKEMFGRLGSHHSNVFGVMDLTAGYHQAPVGLGTRIFLAFICFCGIFQFCRLPFGPKRAPSYFQQMMSSIVLAGMIYFICEVYLDDVIVHAKTDDEFIIRLEKVLERFSKHHIILKPSKCKFGFALLEYCGKQIDENGLSMSEKKIQKVIDFPKPTTAHQMKQFVGLVNYFHDHVNHHADIMKALHNTILGYEKRTRSKTLIWTEEASLAFDQIIKEIEKNHTMYFPRDDCPITLQTDSSQYGIGAYCFQTIDNKEQPVAFVSKSLTEPQFKWGILQKEAYAILYALKKLQGILRDRKFTLETDNRGLAFMKGDANPMVQRWLVSVQEYDFKLVDILGKNNPVADGLSRLVANNMPEKVMPAKIIASLVTNNMPAHMLTALVPPEKIPEYLHILIGKVHNDRTGHHGLERTLRMITTPSSPGSEIILVDPKTHKLRSHIRQYIATCPCCQKMSMLKTAINSHPFTTSRFYPMERLCMDYIGPFPDGGYIMVIMDAFTNWVELFHSPQASSTCAAQNLFQHFGRYGTPTQLVSDRGSHFVNKVIEEFISLVGTDHCLTLAYSSQQNAKVERVNKEINRHLRTLVFESNSVENYKDYLPIVQRIINSAYSDKTHMSSAQMLFGNAINLDRGLFLPPLERPQQGQPLSDHMSKMLQFQDEVMIKARTILHETDSVHMASKSSAIPTEYAPETYVLVKYRNSSNLYPAPTRLHTFWKGPLKVISNVQSQYLLLDIIKNKEKYYHVTDMKPFIFDPLLINPQDIARKDYLEFFVEKILNISGNINRNTTLEFLVKWTGYDDTHNLWVPYKDLRETEVLHQYLKKINLKHLIPKKFQTTV